MVLNEYKRYSNEEDKLLLLNLLIKLIKNGIIIKLNRKWYWIYKLYWWNNIISNDIIKRKNE